MKLIVGLGNPGMEYQLTPHNMGFLVIDRLAEQHGARVSNRHCRSLTAKIKVGETEALLAKPETFMNLSGTAVRELVTKYEADAAADLIVIYDELDFPLGTVRIRERGSSAGHNGLESIIEALNTQEFVRVRLGIAPEHKVTDGARYVLSQIKKAQYKTVDAVLDRAAEAVEAIVKEGVSRAMNRFNQREKD
jgi:PTH1 family peptidyl-tRNA hydrolase